LIHIFPLIQLSDEIIHQSGATVARSFAPPVAGLLESGNGQSCRVVASTRLPIIAGRKAGIPAEVLCAMAGITGELRICNFSAALQPYRLD
jgi:hypothetical protein